MQPATGKEISCQAAPARVSNSSGEMKIDHADIIYRLKWPQMSDYETATTAASLQRALAGAPDVYGDHVSLKSGHNNASLKILGLRT